MKRFMVVFMAVALMAVAGAAFADEPGYFKFDAFDSPEAAKSVSAGDAARFPGSDVAETGAVPGMSERESSRGVIPPTSTHYNPQFPERRWIDLGGGGN